METLGIARGEASLFIESMPNLDVEGCVNTEASTKHTKKEEKGGPSAFPIPTVEESILRWSCQSSGVLRRCLSCRPFGRC